MWGSTPFTSAMPCSPKAEKCSHFSAPGKAEGSLGMLLCAQFSPAALQLNPCSNISHLPKKAKQKDAGPQMHRCLRRHCKRGLCCCLPFPRYIFRMHALPITSPKILPQLQGSSSGNQAADGLKMQLNGLNSAEAGPDTATCVSCSLNPSVLSFRDHAAPLSFPLPLLLPAHHTTI